MHVCISNLLKFHLTTCSFSSKDMISIAKNASRMKNCSRGYILSNDLYRDAIERERRKSDGNDTLYCWLKSARVSYTFCNMGMNRILFVPNPRHELIQAIEG